MRLNELTPAKGAKKEGKRLGRGHSAGQGKKIEIIKTLIGQDIPEPATKKESAQEMMLGLTGEDITLCPRCKKGKLVKKVPSEELIETLIQEVELMAKEKESEEGNSSSPIFHFLGRLEFVKL